MADPLFVIMLVVFAYAMLGVDRILGRFLCVYGSDLYLSGECGVSQEVELFCLSLVVRANGLRGW